MIPGLLVLAASALLNHQNNRDAQKRRESFRQSMDAYQRTKARESEAATEALLAKQTPVAREAELAQVTADRAQSLKDTVGAAQAFDVAPTVGKASVDRRAAEEADAASVAERTRRAIEQLATMGAPGEVKNAHGIRFGRAAGTVDAANRASSLVGAGYERDMAGVTPDPFLGLVSQVGQGVGQGMMAAPAAGAEVNNGQGFEDASGNLYGATTRSRLKNAFSNLWGRS